MHPLAFWLFFGEHLARSGTKANVGLLWMNCHVIAINEKQTMKQDHSKSSCSQQCHDSTKDVSERVQPPPIVWARNTSEGLSSAKAFFALNPGVHDPDACSVVPFLAA
eukprot:1150706-Pelagomonas_calceolata.AAC.11